MSKAEEQIKELKIYEFQAKKIEDTLRLVARKENEELKEKVKHLDK